MDSLISVVQSPLLATIVGPILILLFFWWRVGSIHSVLERLWRLSAGKAEVQDPVLRKFIQENRDLENFRFIYGIKVERPADIRRLKSWLDRYNIGIARLQKAGKWVDVRSKDIVIEPTKQSGIAQIGFLVFWYTIFFLSAQAFEINDAFLQFRQSGTWFRTDGHSISNLFDRAKVELELCATDQEKIAQRMNFTRQEVLAICKDHASTSLRKLIGEGLRFQRILAGTASALAFLLAILSILRMRAMAEARSLCKQLRDHARERSAPKPQSTGHVETHSSPKLRPIPNYCSLRRLGNQNDK